MKKLFSLFLLFFLFGCGYRMKPLKPIRKNRTDYKETIDGVSVRVTKLDKESFKECFNSKGIPKIMIPLMITVKNDSDNAINVASRHISLPLLDHREVYDRMRRSQMGILLGALGVLSAVDIATAVKYPSSTKERVAGVVATDAALLGGTGATIEAAHSNDKFAIDLKSKMLEDITLWDGEKATRIVFADKEQFRRRFKINVYPVNVGSKSKTIAAKRIIFNVVL